MFLAGFCIRELVADSESWFLPLGGVLVGLALAGASFFVLQGHAWARSTLLMLGFGAALIGLAMGAGGKLGTVGDVFFAIILPLALLVYYTVLATVLTSPETSRSITGNDGKFLNYLALQTGVQVLLVTGIVLYAFHLVDDFVARWDLTEDERFSISEYSRELAGSLENPLTIRAYFSDELPPRVQPFQRQVFDVLAEYEKSGKGKVRIERRDPLASSADESEARTVRRASDPAARVRSHQGFGAAGLRRDRARLRRQAVRGHQHRRALYAGL